MVHGPGIDCRGRVGTGLGALAVLAEGVSLILKTQIQGREFHRWENNLCGRELTVASVIRTASLHMNWFLEMMALSPVESWAVAWDFGVGSPGAVISWAHNRRTVGSVIAVVEGVEV